MKQQYVYGLAAFLAVVGLAVFFYKWQVLDFPVNRDQEASVWTIESSISFDSGPGSIKVNLLIPTLTPGFRMLNENSVSRGYGFSLNYGSGGREAQWAIRRADGPQTIYYRISVYEDEGVNQSDTTPPFPPPPVINEPFKTAVDVIVADVREHSADTPSFTSELLRRVGGSKTTIYTYFGDKAGLFTAVVDDMLVDSVSLDVQDPDAVFNHNRDTTATLSGSRSQYPGL